MNILMFCDVTACSLVKSYHCLGGICCLHLFTLKVEAPGYSETLLHFCQTTRRHTLDYVLKIQ